MYKIWLTDSLTAIYSGTYQFDYVPFGLPLVVHLAIVFLLSCLLENLPILPQRLIFGRSVFGQALLRAQLTMLDMSFSKVQLRASLKGLQNNALPLGAVTDISQFIIRQLATRNLYHDKHLSNP